MPQKQSGFLHLIPLLLIMLGIVVGVYLVIQNPQIFKSNAASDKTRLEFVNDKGDVITQTDTTKVKVRLVYVPQNSPSPIKPTSSPKGACVFNKDCPKGQYCYTDGSCRPLPGPTNITTCKGESRTWAQLDSDLKGANFPGPYDHTQQELDAYNRAACPQKTSLINQIIPDAYALTPGGKACAYSENGACHLGNCLDGSQNCSTNNNCGYVPGYSSGKVVDCSFQPSPSPSAGGASCTYTENGVCHQGNCLDGSQNCSFNQNCGYVTGYSTGKTVSCPGATSSPSTGDFGLRIFTLTDYGINVDPRDPQKVPSADQFQYLNPAWIRYEYFPSIGLVKNVPSGVKQLLIFDYSSVGSDFPRKRSSLDTDWVSYINGPFTTSLTNLLNNVNVNAIEIWNEEDDSCSGGPTGYCPTVPADAYAAMLKKASQMIKAKYPSIKVIMGGTDSGNTGYVQAVKNAGGLDQVDAVAIHPYGKSLSGWNPSNSLPFGDLAQMISDYQKVSGKDVWITETSLPTADQALQKEYLQRLSKEVTGSPVVIWYAFTDKMNPNYGLVDAQGNLKQVATAFHDLTAPSTLSYPTSFKLANSKEGLDKAPEQLFDQNDKVVDWTLDNTPGLRTVYASFKVNGVWSEPVSESIIYKAAISKYDVNGDGKVNQDDVNVFLQMWKSGKYSTLIDFNSDRAINLIDYLMILRAPKS